MRLAAIREGDVVRVRTRQGDDFYAVVVPARNGGAGGGDPGARAGARRLTLSPIGPGTVTRYSAGARDVVGHWRRAAGGR